MTDQTEIIKLTEWENEPSVEDLKQNLDDAAIDNQSHLADVERWKSNLYVEGKAKPKKVPGRSSVQPKLIRKQAEWRYSSLSDPFLSSPDIFEVKPVSAGDRKRAFQNALVLNHQFRNKLDRIDFIDEYVREAVDLGTVIVKLGWVHETRSVEVEKPVYNFIPVNSPELAQKYAQLCILRKTDNDAFAQVSNPGLDASLNIFAQTGKTVVAQPAGSKIVTETVDVKNQPTLEVCTQENLIIDPSCNGDIAKASFIGEKFKSSLSELRKDGRYQNLKFIETEGNDPLTDADYNENDDMSSFSFKDSPRKQFVVHSYYGYWDIHNTGIVEPIVAYWVGSVMIRLEENPFPDKEHPFVSAAYMPKRKSIFGEPDGELLEDNQLIIGAVTRGMIDLMGKSANSQTGFKRGMLDVTNFRKYRRGEDYEFNGTDDPRQGIYTHTYPDIPASAFNIISLQNAEAESLTGVKAYSTGISGAALGDSVRNGRSALDAASKREVGILRRLATGIIKIGRKIIAMNAEWLSEEEVVRLTNDEFIRVRRDDLAGYFDLDLTISTAEEDNKKAEELAFMLQTIGNNMDMGLQQMILSDIARLRKMPGIAQKIEQYQPKPDPLTQLKMQLEVQLLKSQVAKEQALAMKHASEAEMNGVQGMKEMTQARLNAAKAKTEEAKAQQIKSLADRTDLDFLEQESGVHQIRELEQIRAKNNKPQVS